MEWALEGLNHKEIPASCLVQRDWALALIIEGWSNAFSHARAQIAVAPYIVEMIQYTLYVFEQEHIFVVETKCDAAQRLIFCWYILLLCVVAARQWVRNH